MTSLIILFRFDTQAIIDAPERCVIHEFAFKSSRENLNVLFVILFSNVSNTYVFLISENILLNHIA